MVTWIITLLISWLTGRGYSILREDEYALMLGRINNIEKRLDTLTENVKTRGPDEVTVAEIVSEWLNGEAKP